MYDIACRAKSVIPPWILRAFGVSDGGTTCDSFRSPSTGQRGAFSLYDNLNGSPDAPLSIPVVGRDGRTRMVNTSVTALSLLSLDHAARKRELEDALRPFVDNGWFSRTKLPASDRNAMLVGNWRGNRGTLTRANALYDAETCLAMPSPAYDSGAPPFYSSSDPRALPEWFPVVRLDGHALYPTPRLLSPDTPSPAIRDAYERLCTAIHRHLESRNTTLRFHPAVVAALAPMNVDSRFADPDIWYPYSEWRSANGNPEYYFRNTINHATIRPYTDGAGWAFSNHPLWFRSLDARCQKVVLDSFGRVTQGVYNLGGEAISFQVNAADAILEIVRIVNVAGHLLATDDASPSQRVLVDQHAAMTLKSNLQPLAMRHAGIPSGQGLVESLEAAKRERNARYLRARSEAIGVAGYESTGDDGADITALTIDSVGLAVSAGMSVASTNPIAGAVVAVGMFVIAFGSGIIKLFTSVDRPVDPTALPFRVLRGSDRPWSDGNVRQSIALPIPYTYAILEPTTYRGL